MKKKERILIDDLGKNLENSREKKDQYTAVNLIFVHFWRKMWILSDEWGHFFKSVKKADNGSVFWKDTLHFLVTKKVRYTSIKLIFDEKRAVGEGTFGANFFLILIVFSKKKSPLQREWVKYPIWSNFSGRGEGHFGKIVEGGHLANTPSLILVKYF